MKYKWLNKNGNEKIIVFFNGWGMDEKIISHLDCSGYDVLMFCDYRGINTEKFDLSSYKKKYLIAWSMGVFVCNVFYDLLKDFDRKIAINGTLKPIDDEYGIPVMIYDLMIANFNEMTSEKFVKKISTNDNITEYCTRSSEELKEELIEIKKIKPRNFIKFDKAVISLKDRIISSKNQKRFWESQNVEIQEMKALHSIFDGIKKWDELL